MLFGLGLHFFPTALHSHDNLKGILDTQASRARDWSGEEERALRALQGGTCGVQIPVGLPEPLSLHLNVGVVMRGPAYFPTGRLFLLKAGSVGHKVLPDSEALFVVSGLSEWADSAGWGGSQPQI